MENLNNLKTKSINAIDLKVQNQIEKNTKSVNHSIKQTIDLKQLIANFAGVNAVEISESPRPEMGDFCLPCFALAKQQGISANLIAEDFKQKLSLQLPPFIKEIQTVGGYLNFYLNKEVVAPLIVQQCFLPFSHKNFGAGKTVCIDYCSPNLAKYMHIGHVANLVIGESLRRIHVKMGFDVKRICYVGDYGTPFGKMVVAIKKWSNIEKVREGGIDEIQNLYIKFAQVEAQDENLINEARAASKMIEQQQGDAYAIYKIITEIAVEECKRVVALMDVEFDDWRGESTYSNQMNDIINELQTKQISHVENGATIVDLQPYDLHVAVVQRSDGGSVYLTRDLTAAQDRYNLYNFDAMLYVVASEQKLHFAQLFKILELMGKPYAKNLTHISYGLFSMREGKISSRKGKQALFTDIYAEGVAAAENVIKEKQFEIENKTNVVKKIARSAVAFSALKIERNKDKVFDKEKTISFDGETAPYVQYTYARCCSLIRKYQTFKSKFAIQENLSNQKQINTQGQFAENCKDAEFLQCPNNINTENCDNEQKSNLIAGLSSCSINTTIKTLAYAAKALQTQVKNVYSQNFMLFKKLYNIDGAIMLAYQKNEPCLIAREILDLCQEFNSFYHDCKILNEENPESAKTLMNIVYAVKHKLEETMPLVMIDLVVEM